MVTLRLSEEHAECLVDVLETALSELRMEISHTDNSTYRAGLKARKVRLEHVAREVERLMEAAAP